MTNLSTRLSAAAAYIPVIGWLYILLTQRSNPLAVFHLRQAVGLCLFLIGALATWAVVAYVLAWLPLMVVVSVALFTVVIAAYVYGAVAWIIGLTNALRNRKVTLPVFGRWANRLPIAASASSE
jgi:uncharacterized membrane protein